MDSDRELVLVIVMGPRKGLTLCHGIRRQLTEEEQFKVGRQIAEQLKLYNYQIKPPPRSAASWHGMAGTERRLGTFGTSSCDLESRGLILRRARP